MSKTPYFNLISWKGAVSTDFQANRISKKFRLRETESSARPRYISSLSTYRLGICSLKTF